MVTPDIHWTVIVITCLFMVFDILTGFLQAVENKNVSSVIMKQGLFHKCGFLIAITFGCLCEYAMHFIDLGFTIPIQDAVCLYIIILELVSILENLCKISPELNNSKFMEIFNNVNCKDIVNGK